MADCNFGTPLSNSDLENRAQRFESQLESSFNDNPWGLGRILAKRISQQFVEQTLKLDGKQDRFDVLRRAQELNDITICKTGSEKLPVVNIVFGDFDSSGKRDQLAEFRLIQRTGDNAASVEIPLDLYHR